MWAFIKHVKLFCVLLLNLDMRVLKLPGSAYQRTTVSSLTVFMKSWIGFEGVDAQLNNKEHANFVWFSVMYSSVLLWFLLMCHQDNVILLTCFVDFA